MWVLGIEPEPSGGAVGALSHCHCPPVPFMATRASRVQWLILQPPRPEGMDSSTSAVAHQLEDRPEAPAERKDTRKAQSSCFFTSLQIRSREGTGSWALLQSPRPAPRIPLPPVRLLLLKVSNLPQQRPLLETRCSDGSLWEFESVTKPFPRCPT